MRAGVRLPVASRYDGFPQYENGIGLSRTLIDEWHRIKRRRLSASHPATSARPAKRLTVVTGALASTILTPILAEMNALTGTRLQCHVVQNSFFGESVTVTGLLTGTDVVASLRKAQLNDGVILPAAMFNRCHRSLDDSALSDIASALDVPTAAGGSLYRSKEANSTANTIW